MKARTRSISGGVTAILIIPFIIGLLACLPVPIGDPERSRIDQETSGMWLEIDEGDEVMVTLFEPYDKRTWLVTRWDLEIRIDEKCDADVDYFESHLELLENLRELGEQCLESAKQMSYKAWTTKLGNTWFMTWEPKAAFHGERRFEPDMWLGFRIERESADKFVLRMIDIDAGVFKEFRESEVYEKLDEQGYPRDPRVLRAARREFERVLKRNADNDEIYDLSDVEPLHYFRIQPGDFDLFLNSVVPRLD